MPNANNCLLDMSDEEQITNYIIQLGRAESLWLL